MRRGWPGRKLLAGVSVLGVLGLAILPPEHLHARRTPDGHQLNVVHRHFEAHDAADAGARVGHDDVAPRWLESPFVNSSPATHVARLEACVEHELPTAAPHQAGLGAVRLVRFSVHDPPPGAVPGRRAPPFPSV